MVTYTLTCINLFILDLFFSHIMSLTKKFSTLAVAANIKKMQFMENWQIVWKWNYFPESVAEVPELVHTVCSWFTSKLKIHSVAASNITMLLAHGCTSVILSLLSRQRRCWQRMASSNDIKIITQFLGPTLFQSLALKCQTNQNKQLNMDSTGRDEGRHVPVMQQCLFQVELCLISFVSTYPLPGKHNFL